MRTIDLTKHTRKTPSLVSTRFKYWFQRRSKHYKTRGGKDPSTLSHLPSSSNVRFIERSDWRSVSEPYCQLRHTHHFAPTKIHKLAVSQFLGCLDMVENEEFGQMFYLFYLDLKTECLKRKENKQKTESKLCRHRMFQWVIRVFACCRSRTTLEVVLMFRYIPILFGSMVPLSAVVV